MWLPVGRSNSEVRGFFFLIDQQTERKMILTTLSHGIFQKKASIFEQAEAKRRCREFRATTDKQNQVDDDKVLVVPSKLLSFKLVTNYTAIEDDSSDTGEEDVIQFEAKEVIGENRYTRKLVSVSDISCILADRRLSSIR